MGLELRHLQEPNWGVPVNKRTFCWGGDGVGGRKEASAELLSALDSSVVTSGGASERVFFFFLYCNT